MRCVICRSSCRLQQDLMTEARDLYIYCFTDDKAVIHKSQWCGVRALFHASCDMSQSDDNQSVCSVQLQGAKLGEAAIRITNTKKKNP